MIDPFDRDDAATPLTEEERAQLIPSYITLRAELNEAEQANILRAQEWAANRRRDYLDERTLQQLHKRMFDRVWRWAGNYRNTARNVGVDAYRIREDMPRLTSDCRYWVKHGTYSADEIAVRFHHRLTWIHPFPNGNGRHARLSADLLVASLGQAPFSWGSGANLVDASAVRSRYVAALRAADGHDFTELVKFVRS